MCCEENPLRGRRPWWMDCDDEEEEPAEFDADELGLDPEEEEEEDDG